MDLGYPRKSSDSTAYVAVKIEWGNPFLHHRLPVRSVTTSANLFGKLRSISKSCPSMHSSHSLYLILV